MARSHGCIRFLFTVGISKATIGLQPIGGRLWKWLLTGEIVVITDGHPMMTANDMDMINCTAYASRGRSMYLSLDMVIFPYPATASH